MKLKSGAHLAYCTNIHRGETWAETMAGLDRHTLAVRRRVGEGRPYGLGLRLSAQAAAELGAGDERVKFQRWLDRNEMYVFTINGFPYGNFHAGAVKERVYAPDWAEPERLEYTVRLFELLAQLVPAGVEGSVSTVPGSFKGFMQPGREERIFAQLTECARRIDAIAERSGRDLHLGLEPEPLCLLETTPETVDFFGRWRAAEPDAARLARRVGVNYDCCHLAVEFEDPKESLGALAAANIRLSKLHLSSALRVTPDAAGRSALAALVEPTYLHQVVCASRCGPADAARALAKEGNGNECSQGARDDRPRSDETSDKGGAQVDHRVDHDGARRDEGHGAGGVRAGERDSSRARSRQRRGESGAPSGPVGEGGRAGAPHILHRYVDLNLALDDRRQSRPDEEWRVHFHIPLHSAPGGVFMDTRDHLLGALDWLRDHPHACTHLEMETYTWAVLPEGWKSSNVEDQLVREYEWTLGECAKRGR